MTLHDIVERLGEQFTLTRSERTILRYMLLGADNETVSNELHLSVKTVKNYISNILHKADGIKRKELQALALQLVLEDEQGEVRGRCHPQITSWDNHAEPLAKYC